MNRSCSCKADLTADLTTDLTSDLTAKLTADRRADRTADLTSDLTAKLTADLTVNLSTDLTSILSADLTADLTAKLTACLTANISTYLTAILSADLTADLTAKLTSDLTGNLSADLIANLTADLIEDLTPKLTSDKTADLRAGSRKPTPEISDECCVRVRDGYVKSLATSLYPWQPWTWALLDYLYRTIIWQGLDHIIITWFDVRKRGHRDGGCRLQMTVIELAFVNLKGKSLIKHGLVFLLYLTVYMDYNTNPYPWHCAELGSFICYAVKEMEGL